MPIPSRAMSVLVLLALSAPARAQSGESGHQSSLLTSRHPTYADFVPGLEATRQTPHLGSLDLSADLSLDLDVSFGVFSDDKGSTQGAGNAPGAGQAQDAASLAIKLQNPVASLISVPFQFNWDTGIGPGGDKDKVTLNIQPVIPFRLNDDWNLISRTILPLVYAEGPVSGIDSEFGIGDTTQSLFFSPAAKIDDWIMGFGPVLYIPTGTDDLFRAKQFGMGPTAVFLRQDPVNEGTLTWGILANHIWKVAGSDDVPDINSTFLQPFIGYTTKGGTSFFVNTETSYDWTGEEWSVPLNASVSHLFHFGEQPVQLQFGGRYYLDTVPDGPEWGLRFSITFLFPK